MLAWWLPVGRPTDTGRGPMVNWRQHVPEGEKAQVFCGTICFASVTMSDGRKGFREHHSCSTQIWAGTPPFRWLQRVLLGRPVPSVHLAPEGVTCFTHRTTPIPLHVTSLQNDWNIRWQFSRARKFHCRGWSPKQCVRKAPSTHQSEWGHWLADRTCSGCLQLQGF